MIQNRFSSRGCGCPDLRGRRRGWSPLSDPRWRSGCLLFRARWRLAGWSSLSDPRWRSGCLLLQARWRLAGWSSLSDSRWRSGCLSLRVRLTPRDFLRSLARPPLSGSIPPVRPAPSCEHAIRHLVAMACRKLASLRSPPNPDGKREVAGGIEGGSFSLFTQEREARRGRCGALSFPFCGARSGRRRARSIRSDARRRGLRRCRR